MKHCLNKPIIKLALINDTKVSIVHKEYGKALFARIALQVIGGELEETILEYGFVKEKKILFVKVEDIEELENKRKNKKIYNIQKPSNIPLARFKDKDLTTTIKEFYVSIGLDTLKNKIDSPYSLQQEIEWLFYRYLTEEKEDFPFLANVEKSFCIFDIIPYPCLQAIFLKATETDNNTSIKFEKNEILKLSDEEKRIFQIQKDIGMVKEVLLCMKCISKEKLESFLDKLEISLERKADIVMPIKKNITALNCDCNSLEELLHRFQEFYLQFDSYSMIKLLTWSTNNIDVNSDFAISGDYINKECVLITKEDYDVYLPSNDWDKLKYNFRVGPIVNYEISLSDIYSKLESLGYIDEDNEKIEKIFRKSLENFWERDFVYADTFCSQMNVFFVKTKLNDKLVVIVKECKEIMIISSYTYFRDSDYPFIIAKEATIEEVELVVQELLRIKENLIDNIVKASLDILVKKIDKEN